MDNDDFDEYEYNEDGYVDIFTRVLAPGYTCTEDLDDLEHPIPVFAPRFQSMLRPRQRAKRVSMRPLLPPISEAVPTSLKNLDYHMKKINRMRKSRINAEHMWRCRQSRHYFYNYYH